MRAHGFFVLAAATSSLANAATPIHLAPSSQWILDYAENSCRLVRRFGDAKDMTTLAFESEASGFLDMLIIGKPLVNNGDDVPVNFVPIVSEPMRGSSLETVDKNVPSILVNRVRLLSAEAIAAEKKRDAEQKVRRGVRPPAVSLAEQAEKRAQRQAFAAKTLGVEIEPRRNHPVILDTGSLGEPVKALDQCSRDSLRDWGVDPDREDKIVRGVWAPKPSAWFSPDDYPGDMLATRRESVVKVRVLVDATGHVTKCTTVSHFKEPEFDKITCANFTARAHFEPAELADGTKVPSYYVNNIVWRLAR